MEFFETKLLVILSLVTIGETCPDYWTAFGGSCYEVFHQHSTWDEAVHLCEHFDAKLVSIESPAENRFVASQLLREHDYDVFVWIGGNDLLREGVWEWESGAAFHSYTAWYPGEPNSEGGEENCLTIRPKEATWNDYQCSLQKTFVCEMINPTDPVGRRYTN